MSWPKFNFGFYCYYYFMKIHFKSIFGSLIAYLYNYHVSNINLSKLRNFFLKIWLLEYKSNSFVGKGVFILNGRKLKIKHSTYISENCLLDGRKYYIEIGKNVFIGRNSSIITLGHDPQSKDFKDKGGDVIIEDNVNIGKNVTILAGVIIGRNAKIISGSVVTKNILPNSIVGGKPAFLITKKVN